MDTWSNIQDIFKINYLDNECLLVYKNLCIYHEMSILEMSRSTGIERTKVYRLIDQLTRLNLVETISKDKRHTYKAAPLTNLHIKLAADKATIDNTARQLDRLDKILSQDKLESPLTKVQFYSGVDGIKQMLWNQTKSKTEVSSILYQNIQTKVGKAFFERWAERCNERGLIFKSVVGSQFIDSQKAWYGGILGQMLDNWSAKIVDKSVHEIAHQTTMYDNVVTYFNWQGNDIYGIELHNPDIAKAQKVFFDYLWSLGKDYNS